ncbi:hypothetical protein PO124_13005 [Bacillus licheniformis]|nr:hypothetical protein [Bacillus licheniformis]
MSQLELVGYTVAVLAVTYQLALGASSLEDKTTVTNPDQLAY